MRAAPPAAMPLSASWRLRGAVSALYAMAGAALALWLRAQWSSLVPQPMGVATAVAWLIFLSLLSATLGWWVAGRLLPARPGALVWSGRQWLWWPDTPAPAPLPAPLPARADEHPPAVAHDTSTAGTPVAQVVVAMAGGGWLLLRWLPEGGRWRWSWVAAIDRPQAWHAFRVALHAHAGPSSRAAAPRQRPPTPPESH